MTDPTPVDPLRCEATWPHAADIRCELPADHCSDHRGSYTANGTRSGVLWPNQPDTPGWATSRARGDWARFGR